MNNISCKTCNSAFSSMNDYNNHELQHHTRNTSYPCTQCGKVFMTEQCLSDHLHECTQAIQFLQPSNLTLGQPPSQCTPEKVQESSSGTQIIECFVCGNLFPCGHDMQTHMVQSHGCSYGNFSNTQETSQVFQTLFSCNYCAAIFKTQPHLEEHINQMHNLTVNPANSSYPSIMLPSTDLNLTPNYQASNMGTKTCTTCGYTCNSEEMLNLHLPSHERNHVVHCSKCELSFDSVVLLNVHNAQHHTESEDDDEGLSDIDQLDGNTSLVSTDGFTFPDNPSPKYPPVVTRNASYSLNTRKQTASITSDTALNDFEISTNNRGQNINIKCNHGFYQTLQ